MKSNHASLDPGSFFKIANQCRGKTVLYPVGNLVKQQLPLPENSPCKFLHATSRGGWISISQVSGKCMNWTHKCLRGLARWEDYLSIVLGKVSDFTSICSSKWSKSLLCVACALHWISLSLTHPLFLSRSRYANATIPHSWLAVGKLLHQFW